MAISSTLQTVPAQKLFPGFGLYFSSGHVRELQLALLSQHSPLVHIGPLQIIFCPLSCCPDCALQILSVQTGLFTQHSSVVQAPPIRDLQRWFGSDIVVFIGHVKDEHGGFFLQQLSLLHERIPTDGSEGQVPGETLLHASCHLHQPCPGVEFTQASELSSYVEQPIHQHPLPPGAQDGFHERLEVAHDPLLFWAGYCIRSLDIMSALHIPPPT